MKVKNKHNEPVFNPVVITIETKEELMCLEGSLNHLAYASTVGAGWANFSKKLLTSIRSRGF